MFGFGILSGLLVLPLIGAAFGYVIEKGMIRHLYDKPVSIILATWGLGMVLQQAGFSTVETVATTATNMVLCARK